jgi:hypothetical protein
VSGQIPHSLVMGLCLYSSATQYLCRYCLGFDVRHITKPKSGIGHSDKVPVLSWRGRRTTCKKGSESLGPRTFYPGMLSCLEPSEWSVGNVPGGQLSLSGSPECLSLQPSILFQRSKNGEKNEDNEQDHRNERQESHAFTPLDIRDVQFYV